MIVVILIIAEFLALYIAYSLCLVSRRSDETSERLTDKKKERSHCHGKN